MKRLLILSIFIISIVMLLTLPSCAKAEFELSNLSVSPEQITEGESAKVTIDVTNTGNAEGTYLAIMKINDEESSQQENARLTS